MNLYWLSVNSLNISTGSMDVVPSVFQLDCFCDVWGHTTRPHGLHFLRCNSISDVYFVHDIQQSWCLDSCIQVSIRWKSIYVSLLLYWAASSDLGDYFLFLFCKVYTLVFIVLCALRAYRGLLCYKLDSCRCVWQFQRTGWLKVDVCMVLMSKNIFSHCVSYLFFF